CQAPSAAPQTPDGDMSVADDKAAGLDPRVTMKPADSWTKPIFESGSTLPQDGLSKWPVGVGNRRSRSDHFPISGGDSNEKGARTSAPCAASVGGPRPAGP